MFRIDVKMLCMALVGFLAVPLVAIATPISVPAGLNPGDQYRLVFVTSTTTNAVSSDIKYYNSFVSNVANSQANLASLGATWTAIASTTFTNARSNTLTCSTSIGCLSDDLSYVIYNLFGEKVADNNTDLWDGSLDSTIAYNENGIKLQNSDGYYVWTGTGAVGGTGGVNRLGSSCGVAGTCPTYGWWGAIDKNWASYGANFPLANQLHLYAISSVLTAPVPAPATLALFGLGLAGLGWSRRSKA